MGLVRERRKTRQIRVGDVGVGSEAKISVQSMTNTQTQDVEATVAQIQALENAGCEIIVDSIIHRLSILDAYSKVRYYPLAR